MDPHGGSPLRDQTGCWRGSDQLPPAAAAILSSGWRQNAVGSEALFPGLFLVSSLFPSLISLPKRSQSLGQRQEEVAGTKMALPLRCERGFGVEEAVQVVTLEAGLQEFSSGELCARNIRA